MLLLVKFDSDSPCVSQVSSSAAEKKEPEQTGSKEVMKEQKTGTISHILDILIQFWFYPACFFA